MHISPEAEATLIEEARKQGMSVEGLLEQLISKCRDAAVPERPNPELPAWNLGVVGNLHRRDIYDDVS